MLYDRIWDLTRVKAENRMHTVNTLLNQNKLSLNLDNAICIAFSTILIGIFKPKSLIMKQKVIKNYLLNILEYQLIKIVKLFKLITKMIPIKLDNIYF